VTDRFWNALAGELGGEPLPRPVRTFIEEEGYPRDWEQTNDPEELQAIARRAASAVINLAAAGLLPREESHSVADFGGESADPRWRLLADLDARLAQEHGVEPDWSPVTACRVSGANGPTEERLVVSIDPQAPLRHVVDALVRLWPELRRKGWLRRTRPLGERSADLLRFVCLENPPGTPWGELWRGWNDSHPDPAERIYHESRFRAEFRRLEKQVSGRKGGLRVFYEPGASSSSDRAWMDLPLGEVAELAQRGDYLARDALREILRAAEAAVDRGAGETTPRGTSDAQARAALSYMSSSSVSSVRDVLESVKRPASTDKRRDSHVDGEKTTGSDDMEHVGGER